ncbi:MAG: hypothetical protein FRX48_00884 [Lasallia pustulata]|uniref:DUF1746 domain-containing protein n=1 Tax=Lasallia pustulata TaxID=136370 RepID=A0A5M8Q1T5_9LECA|nr:MAG: hypothetical protein FRX48_00884 [Lasallia pustulata]
MTPPAPPPRLLPPPKPHPQRLQRSQHLDHLLRTLDILIYSQLSILYYMDCSLPHLLLRALPHYLLFTPRPPHTAPPPHRPYTTTILLTNILVLLLHVFSAAPAAGDAARGYLHGGLVMDIVGEAGPVGKWRLDVDLEERGMVRAEGRGDRVAGFGGEGGGADEGADHPLDAFYTGEYVIANLHVLGTLRRQWMRYRNVSVDASTSSTTGSQTAMAAAGAGRRFGFPLRVGDGVLGPPS